MELAANICDVIKETVAAALTNIGDQTVIPLLIEAIIDGAKESAREGEIGPSSVALLRNWYDDHKEGEGEFFAHVGLPRDCTWKAFRCHYMTRKRIDHPRHAADLTSFPPIAERIKPGMYQGGAVEHQVLRCRSRHPFLGERDVSPVAGGGSVWKRGRAQPSSEQKGEVFV